MDASYKVTFDAFVTPDGTGPLDLRVIVPKKKYLIVAEDDSYYYLQPTEALSQHAIGEAKP